MNKRLDKIMVVIEVLEPFLVAAAFAFVAYIWTLI